MKRVLVHLREWIWDRISAMTVIWVVGILRRRNQKFFSLSSRFSVGEYPYFWDGADDRDAR